MVEQQRYCLILSFDGEFLVNEIFELVQLVRTVPCSRKLLYKPFLSATFWVLLKEVRSVRYNKRTETFVSPSLSIGALQKQPIFWKQ